LNGIRRGPAKRPQKLLNDSRDGLHHLSNDWSKKVRRMNVCLPVAAVTLALITGCTPATEIGSTTSASTSAEQGTKTVSVPKLSILLTNDDGWKAPGIRAVYAALAAAGHDVTVVAPSANQSGASGRKTFWGDLVVAHPDLVPYPEYSGAKVWSVGPVEGKTGGSPADSVSFGLATVFKDKKPDLVVSGTNLGQNTGGVTNNSGTVGAVAEAIESGIPSIAVSTEIKADYDPADESMPDFKPTADYLTGLVGKLAVAAEGGPLLPANTGLNVNHPGKTALGTKFTAVDLKDPYPLNYVETAPGTYKIEYKYAGNKDDLSIDTAAVFQGYASVSPIDASFGKGGDAVWLKAAIGG
jgi:5'-nucleotidase